jgi:hypothetical protein
MTTIIDGTAGITYPNNTVQASAGVVLQVVNANYSTQTSTTSSAGTDTGVTATITPKFSTSKILVLVDIAGLAKDTNDNKIALTLFRNSSAILGFERQAGWTGSTASNGVGSGSANFLDSPATTSATTYKVQFGSVTNQANVYVQTSSSTSTITLLEIAG